ncbi:CPBP family intramembrane glutamic endopeptidase [Formosa sp. S-31]|uniref:CPBP family intramembrane glutamic endopeptidase n=1 Tax=Formosa sp. S-31 TaxID=2790949 RepID=UPI003EBBA35F
MNAFINILSLYIRYLRQPDCQNTDLFSGFTKFQVITVALVIAFVLNFGFTIVFTILDILQIINFEDHASTILFEEFPPYAIVLLGVIVAPVLEELIFRAPIPLFCKFKNWFRFIFYGFAILFGVIHITNFEITKNVLLLAPVLVAPQILIGFFLGVIRMQYGLIHSILFHALYNGVLIIPAVLLM